MNEEGESPSGSQPVQSNPMDSLNDEITPKTADKDKKKESIPTKVIHFVGLEKRSVVEERENEVKLLKKSESDLKSRTSQLENEVKLMTIDKKVSNAKMTDKDNEIKSNAEEIEYLKITQAKTEGEWNNRMSEKETEIKSKDEEIQNLKTRISQLEGEAQSMIDNLKNTEIMIRAKFTDISKNSAIYSQPTVHAGITWKMSVYKNCANDIWFFLHGEKKGAVEWLCPVIAEFMLFSQKSKEIVHRQEMREIYDASHARYRIIYEDLFYQKRFVKDDSYIVTVALRAFPRTIDQMQFPEIMIRPKFTEISKLTKEEVYSQSTEFAGVIWKISVRKIQGGIRLGLEGKKDNAVGWWCPVVVEFQLMSQKSKEMVHRRKGNVIYDAKCSSFSLEDISHKVLFNEETGFVKDDSIIVAVTIRAIPTD